jgi:5-methyltetrahydrofolate--homocysteine methyltransferase
VGEEWKTYEYFIPNVLVSAMATKLCLNTLHSLLKTAGNRHIGRVVAETVKGDVHDIGQNIVLRFIETVGYKVIYLGIDVELARFEGIVPRVTRAAFDLPQQQ